MRLLTGRYVNGHAGEGNRSCDEQIMLEDGNSCAEYVIQQGGAQGDPNPNPKHKTSGMPSGQILVKPRVGFLFCFFSFWVPHTLGTD